MSREENIGFLKGILVGGLIGAALGILFAPKSGKETREKIAQKSGEFFSKAKDEIERGLEKSKDAYESMMASVKECREELQGKVASGKEKLEEGKGRLMKAVEAGIDAYKEEKEK